MSHASVQGKKVYSLVGSFGVQLPELWERWPDKAKVVLLHKGHSGRGDAVIVVGRWMVEGDSRKPSCQKDVFATFSPAPAARE